MGMVVLAQQMPLAVLVGEVVVLFLATVYLLRRTQAVAVAVAVVATVMAVQVVQALLFFAT